jgi:hypothetical protein
MIENPRIIPVSDGLLDHRRVMGSSIWEYLWLVAHVTAAAPDGNGHSVGIVDQGNPVPTSRIAAGLRRSREATLANLEKLEDGNYIKRSAAAGHAYDYQVRILLTTREISSL